MKNRLVCLVLITAVLLSVSACDAPKEETSAVNSVVTSTESTGGSIAKAELSSGVKVNAELKIPEDVDYEKLGSFSGSVVRLDYDKCYNAFMQDKEIISTDEHEIAGAYFNDEPYRGMRTADGCDFVFYGETFVFRTMTGSKMLRAMSDASFEELKAYKGYDLSFMSMEAAFNTVKSKLADLGVDIIDFYTCYTLSKENLVTMNGEGYVFSLYVGKNNVPVTDKFNGAFDNGGAIPGSKIRAAVTENGIEALDLVRVYAFDGELKSGNAINLEKALDYVDAKYNSLILDEEKEIYAAELAYVPVSDKSQKNFTMTPAWIIYFNNTINQKSKDGKSANKVNYESYIMINALTSEEIAVDGGEN